MMAPEQQQAFRTRIQSDCVSGVALDRIVVAVSEMLAAERAAERERWSRGTKITIPTPAMEQEIQAHVKRAVEVERERMKSLLLDAHATWHNCRLEESERGLPAGTPCDDCVETVDAAIRAQGGGSKLYAEGAKFYLKKGGGNG